MTKTASLFRLSVLLIIGSCTSAQIISAQQLFFFGNALDRIQLDLTPSQATELFGQADQVEVGLNGGLSMIYSEGTFAGLLLQFATNSDSTQATERYLSGAVLSEPFDLHTDSGIGLGMKREDVRAKIGDPLLKFDMKSVHWESYQEGRFIVHVQYDLDGVLTHLYKVDRSRVRL